MFKKQGNGTAPAQRHDLVHIARGLSEGLLRCFESSIKMGPPFIVLKTCGPANQVRVVHMHPIIFFVFIAVLKGACGYRRHQNMDGKKCAQETQKKVFNQ